MKLLRSGYFSDDLSSVELSKGLRPTAQTPRNSKVLEVCDGMVGQDNILKSVPVTVLHDLYASALVIKNDFPFPQVFALDKHLLVCNRTTVLELVGTALVLKATVTGGELWAVTSSDAFIYLSNGSVSLVRDPISNAYSTTTIGPKCSAICNFNGQIICGNIR